MKLTKWFVHFGVPGWYEGVLLDLDSPDSYRAMMEAFKFGQYAAGQAVYG